MFTVFAAIFGQYTAASPFFNYMGKWITSCWTFWKGSILNTVPSEKFLIVVDLKGELNERELKR